VPGRETRRDSEYERCGAASVFCAVEPKAGRHFTMIEIGLFSRQCLGSRRIPDLKTLRQEAAAWNRQMNRAKTKINWKFTRKAARRKLGYTKNAFTRSRN
jgi:hypothetical protein